MFNHQYFSAQYFPPVWFAPGDDSHLTDEERQVEWLGGGASVYYGKRDKELEKRDYSRLDKTQTEEEKKRQRIELGIIKDDEKIIEPLIKEKAKAKIKKESVKVDSSEYWSLHLYENLLNQEIANQHYQFLLQKLKDNAINQVRIKSIEEAIKRRQSEMEITAAIEIQRIMDDDMVFIMSVLAEI